jgi:hypothetical protein
MSSPKLSTRRLALISGLSLFAVLGAASVCGAESPWRRPITPPVPSPYRVSLEDPSGANLPTFQQAGSTYVLGEPGERYNIRVYNPTGERVEAVVSVDGRDAVSGGVGDYTAQRGYLIEPWGSVLVEGFRRSLEEVAAFRFTGAGRSYSARRGTPQHVGVIGVAVFPEKPRPPAPLRKLPRRYQSESEYRSPPPSAPRAASGSDARAPSAHAERSRDDAAPAKRKGGASNIGTEYGENQGSSVVEVAFERRSPTHPAAVLRVRYDDFDGLQARGIDLSSLGYAYAGQTEPEPFPLSRSRFAPPPR